MLAPLGRRGWTVWMVGAVHDDMLRRAVLSTRTVLARVGSDQLDGPTPCASWTLRDVVEHLIGSARWYSSCALAGHAPPTADDTTVTDGDLIATYFQASDDTCIAFDAEGILDTVIVMPTGPMSGRAVMALAALDAFTHGWDVARATGQSTDLDPSLADALLAFARNAIGDKLRGHDGSAPFAAARAASERASRADQLATFLGRDL
jgi:uncharacterized protein (TIGR03086 family)